MREDLLVRIAATMQGSPLYGLLVINRRFEVELINDSLCGFWNIAREAILHQSLVDAFFAGDKRKLSGAYIGPLIETMDTGVELVPSEVQVPHPETKQHHWYMVNTFLLRDAAGEPEYAVGHYVPIDHFKMIEHRLKTMNINVIKAFCKAIGFRDLYTLHHSENVAALMLGMCDYLKLPGEIVTMAYLSGIVHDIGKIGISEHILNKPNRLTDSEFEIVKRHPSKGAEILAEIEALLPIADIVKHHHERYDGRGYPDGLAGEEIPFLSRMLTICDSYDAMTSVRCYCRPVSQEQAIKEIQLCAGKQFDPDLCPLFVDFIKQCNYEQLAVLTGQTA